MIRALMIATLSFSIENIYNGNIVLLAQWYTNQPFVTRRSSSPNQFIPEIVSPFLCLVCPDMFLIHSCLYIFSKNSSLSLAPLANATPAFSTLWLKYWRSWSSFLSVLCTLSFPSHWLLFHTTIIKTVVSGDRNINPITMTIINSRKETGQSGNQISDSLFSSLACCHHSDLYGLRGRHCLN